MADDRMTVERLFTLAAQGDSPAQFVLVNTFLDRSVMSPDETLAVAEMFARMAMVNKQPGACALLADIKATQGARQYEVGNVERAKDCMAECLFLKDRIAAVGEGDDEHLRHYLPALDQLGMREEVLKRAKEWGKEMCNG